MDEQPSTSAAATSAADIGRRDMLTTYAARGAIVLAGAFVVGCLAVVSLVASREAPHVDVINVSQDAHASGPKAGPREYTKALSVGSGANVEVRYSTTSVQAKTTCQNTTANPVYVVNSTDADTTNGRGPYCTTCTAGPSWVMGYGYLRTSSGTADVRCGFYDEDISLGGGGGSGGGGGTFAGGTLTSGLNLSDANTLCSQTLAEAWNNDLDMGFQRRAADIFQLCIAGRIGMLITKATTPTVLGEGNTFLGDNAGPVTDLTVGSGAYNNTFIGGEAGKSNTSGYQNTFIGERAGFSNTTGFENTFLGQGAGYYNTASQNAYCGFHGGLNLTSGNGNTAFGTQALEGNSAGATNVTGCTAAGFWAGKNIATGATGNTFFGWSVGSNAVVSGLMNTAMGYSTLRDVSSGAQNTCIGREACKVISSQSFNVAVGAQAGIALTDANNTLLGTGAGLSATTASNNVMVGYFAGYTATAANATTTGDNNTFIGTESGYSTTTQFSNATAIGYRALVTASNAVQLGDSNVTLVQTAGGFSSTSAVSSGTILVNQLPRGLGTEGITLPTCATSADAGKMFYVDDKDDAASGMTCVCRANSAGTYANVDISDNSTACIDP